jgi:hypothetical protein
MRRLNSNGALRTVDAEVIGPWATVAEDAVEYCRQHKLLRKLCGILTVLDGLARAGEVRAYKVEKAWYPDVRDSVVAVRFTTGPDIEHALELERRCYAELRRLPGKLATEHFVFSAEPMP